MEEDIVITYTKPKQQDQQHRNDNLRLAITAMRKVENEDISPRTLQRSNSARDYKSASSKKHHFPHRGAVTDTRTLFDASIFPKYLQRLKEIVFVDTTHRMYCEHLTPHQYLLLVQLWQSSDYLVIEYLGLLQNILKRKHGLVTDKNKTFLIGDVIIIQTYYAGNAMANRSQSMTFADHYHRPNFTALIPLILNSQCLPHDGGELLRPLAYKNDNDVHDIIMEEGSIIKTPLNQDYISELYERGCVTMGDIDAEYHRLTLFTMSEFLLTNMAQSLLL